MKYEPKKEIRDLDLTCYYSVGHPWNPENSYRLHLMGSADAFAKLKDLFEVQRDMAKEHGGATRVIHLRKPWEFTVAPFKKSETEGLYFNNQPVTLKFIDSLKIKVVSDLPEQGLVMEGEQATLACPIAQLDTAVEGCEYCANTPRRTHGAPMVSLLDSDENDLGSLYAPLLGDWLGIE